MKDIDIINSIFDENAEKKGVFEKELEYFNSFSEGLKSSDNTIKNTHSEEHVKFDAVNNDFEDYKSNIIRLAAQTTESTTLLKPKFYISRDDKFAIKIVVKNNGYHCSIITNESISLEDILVHCEELDNYFAANNEGQFILSNIYGLDLNELSFNFILPRLSLNLYRILGNFHLISDFKTDKYSIIEEEQHIKINFPTDLRYIKIVLKNDGVKNIISKNDKGILMNRKLLSDKNILLFY